MKKTEAWFSRNIRKAAETLVLIRNFEGCGQAVPDLYVLNRLGSGWIELKVVPTRKCVIPWRPGQQKWMRDTQQAGVKCMVLVYVEAEGVVIGHPYPGEYNLTSTKISKITGWMDFGTEENWPGVAAKIRKWLYGLRP